jgi:hypothetical protein
MSRIQKGMVAGFAATVAVSVMEVANLLIGPFQSFPGLLARILQMPDVPAVGWVAHFIAGGLILGPLFGILCPRLPTDTSETKGVLFAVGAWIVMMLTVAPMAGIGAFAMVAGFPTLAWMLATHIVFGVVLGGVYGRLVARERMAARQHTGVAAAH